MPNKRRFTEVKMKKKRPGKSRYRPSTEAKRRENYYSKGAGKAGLLLRRPRLVRHLRRIRKEQSARYAEITGSEAPTDKTQVIYKGCVDVFMGALDARANQIMKMAHDLVSERSHKGGMKLRNRDLIKATRVIAQLRTQ